MSRLRRQWLCDRKGVAGLSTAFVATYKNAGGGTAISFMAETGLLQFVWQGWAASVIPIAIASTSHHLSVFRTAFGGTVLKTLRF
jgi:hypothetical protein